MRSEPPGDRALAARGRSIDRDQYGPPCRRSGCLALRQGARFDRGIGLWQGAPPNAAGQPAAAVEFKLEIIRMVKPEWGAKRTCPKCSTRFYALGKDDPVHCISCGTDFAPEPVLKSKQPMAFEAAPVAAKEPAEDPELAAEDLAIDEEEEASADEEVDLETGDEDPGAET